MNTPKTLYWTLNALIFLIIISIVFGLVIIGLQMAGKIPDGVYKNSAPYSELDGAAYIFMFLNLMVQFVFIYGLFRLREVSKLFLNNTIYDCNIGKFSKTAGKCFVIAGVFWWVLDGLSSIYYNNKFTIGLGQLTFVYLFFISIGLFLMLFSQFFEKTIQLKEENDLTI